MGTTERPLPPGTGQRPQRNKQYSHNTLSDRGSQGTNKILEAARLALSNGLSVIPAKADKTPALRSWKPYQKKVMSIEVAEKVFRNAHGIGIVCGKVSGNLECLDFDNPTLWPPFIETLEEIIPDLAKKLVKRKTPNGFSLIYRCKDPIKGSHKLAIAKIEVPGPGEYPCDWRPGKKYPAKQIGDKWYITPTAIETRGEGGYFLTYPSPGYALIENSLKNTPVLTLEEVELLHTLIRSFSEKQEPPRFEKTVTVTGEWPGDDYNDKADESIWRSLLEQEGWVFSNRDTAGRWHLTRPGKNKGTSATLKDGYLYVFSTNAGIPPVRHHSAFGVYTHLKHNGDFSVAAKELRRQGYGKTGKTQTQIDSWLEPLPMVSKMDPERYPLDALPAKIQKAVCEVQAFTKAPIPLVASSAFAAISLATQGHIDIRRANKLTGPVSLFLLTIADSGERKSTCDKYFTDAINQYQQKQAKLAKLVLKNHEATFDAWSAKRAGIVDKIRQQSKNNRPTEDLDASLQKLEYEKPVPPKVPKLLRGDETPESLAWNLAREWPSGGVVSSEAGIILGAHGMGKDSIMRNLALLNILWDGGEHSISRRTKESFTVRGARLTMGLQVQEKTLWSFFDRSSDLARGMGFIARFLVAWPESTQGYRQYEDPPENWPALEAFNQRITEILNIPVSLEEEGSLSPLMKDLSQDAKSAWVTFHDDIERKLRSGGQLYDVRDVASKVADNAVRLAALFQFFDHGKEGEVNRESIESASRIVAWNLNEARRLVGELAMPEEIKYAVMLNDWLLDYCRRENTTIIPSREVLQLGPSPLRTKAKRDSALRVLEELDRLQVIQEERRKMIMLNPELMKKEQK